MAVLTDDQLRQLISALKRVMEVGHGEVVIRVKNGVPRFISITEEQELKP